VIAIDGKEPQHGGGQGVLTASSLFMERRSRQPRPEYQTTTDFQSEMAAEHRQRALRIVFSKPPNFGPS
jgi:hypothetical protein